MNKPAEKNTVVTYTSNKTSSKYTKDCTPRPSMRPNSTPFTSLKVKEALLSCAHTTGRLPVKLDTRYLDLTLRQLATSYDLGTPRDQHFALCFEGVTGLTKRCYGTYIDKQYIDKVLNPMHLAIGYTAPCTAITLACGFLTGDWASIIGDAAGTCLTPTIIGPWIKGSVEEHIEKSGQATLWFIPLDKYTLGATGFLAGVGAYAFQTYYAKPALRNVLNYYYTRRYQVIGKVPGARFFTLNPEEVLKAYAPALLGGKDIWVDTEKAGKAILAIVKKSKSVEEAIARIGLARKVYKTVYETGGGGGVATAFLEELAGTGDTITALKRLNLKNLKPEAVKKLGDALKNMYKGAQVTYDTESRTLSISGVTDDLDEIEKYTGETAEKAVEKYADEVEETLEKATKEADKSSLKKGILRGIACSLAGAAAGVLSYYNYYNTITGVTPQLQTLPIIFEDNTLTVGSIAVGG